MRAHSIHRIGIRGVRRNVRVPRWFAMKVWLWLPGRWHWQSSTVSQHRGPIIGRNTFLDDYEPSDQWVTAPDGEEFRVGACQGHDTCPVETHEHGCFADDGNCDHPEEHEPTEEEQKR